MANVLHSEDAALLVDGSALKDGLLNFSHLWNLKLNCHLVASDNIIIVKLQLAIGHQTDSTYACHYVHSNSPISFRNCPLM